MTYEEQRKAAIERIQAKRDFKRHVFVYIVVNLFLVGIWWVSGAGYFWPIWSILGWGFGLAMHGWGVYRGDRPITEEEIRREMGAD